MNPNKEHIRKAREEGRVCSHCGWIIPKKEWKKGHRLCRNCTDAFKGCNVSNNNPPPADEPFDPLEQ